MKQRTNRTHLPHYKTYGQKSRGAYTQTKAPRHVLTPSHTS